MQSRKDTPSTLGSVPLFVIIMGIGSAAMILPALHAWSRSDYFTGRIFLYGTIIGCVVTLLIGLATQGRRPSNLARTQLSTLVATFIFMPVVFALPFHEASRSASFLNSWFEMVSSFTTTGATLYDNPQRIAPSLHLWRALVGWLGGLLTWIAALAILAPLNIGGFEVRSSMRATDTRQTHTQINRRADTSERLLRYGRALIPVYVGLTTALWVGLLAAGEIPFVAICHAMSVMATSGISPIGGTHYGASGVVGEMLIFVFLAFGISRLTFSAGLFSNDNRKLWKDPEVQMAFALVVIVPTLLILRHFVGAAEDAAGTDLRSALAALWGAIFTVLSFLSTTGFESAEWLDARDWSGLETPGLILVGLALVGGGVATTAGGVKLLRVYALFRHSERELERLVHPNSVGGSGQEARLIRRQGAYISWIFFMLFALSIAAVMLMLTATGVQFETAMVLAVSALSTTGPLASVAAEHPISYAGIPEMAKAVLAFAMVLGRMETLAIIALLNPEFWRS